MLTIRNVNKQFDGTPVLNNVSLSVNKGDVIAIIGQSGGGKTTLLRCMNFLETADSGEMEFDGACFDLRHISARPTFSSAARAIYSACFLGILRATVSPSITFCRAVLLRNRL